jgi:hypothetical protein
MWIADSIRSRPDQTHLTICKYLINLQGRRIHVLPFLPDHPILYVPCATLNVRASWKNSFSDSIGHGKPRINPCATAEIICALRTNPKKSGDQFF